MKKTLKLTAVLLAFITLFSFTLKETLPENWFKAGSSPNKYNMGLDSKVFYSGSSSATISSKEKKIKGFGTLMQTCSAKEYLGKRVKMTGYVKTENVKGWTGLWLRIDGEKGTRCLAMDNMGDRKIKGTNDWKQYEIVLDVPKESKTLNFGALLSGTGTIWFDNIEFAVVDKEINTTSNYSIPKKPMNLNFD